MEPSIEILALLDKVPRPVFLVREGLITHTNSTARLLLLGNNMLIEELLYNCHSEYSQFQNGRLYLSILIMGKQYNASVVKVDGYDVFTVDEVYQKPEYRTLVNTAQALRTPLNTAMISIDKLLPQDSTKVSADDLESLQLLKQSLYQILRAVGNMSDAGNYHFSSINRSVFRDIVSFVNEVVQNSASYADTANRRVEFQPLSQHVFCQFDPYRLERAILNLISNAIKYSPAESTVSVALRHKHDKLYIAVQNKCSSSCEILQTDVFSAFLQPPRLNNSNAGTGLGLTIVHGAATAHNGTLLVEPLNDSEVKFTMSISTQITGNNILRSLTQLPVDYTGGYDSTLLELSDILPSSAFE